MYKRVEIFLENLVIEINYNFLPKCEKRTKFSVETSHID